MSLAGPFDQWQSGVGADATRLAAVEAEVLARGERLRGDPDLGWRFEHLLAHIAIARDEAGLAAERLDAAIAAYPVKAYAQPSKQSTFQHLVNERASLLWEEKGLDAALQWACDVLADDARLAFFYAEPWQDRLEARGQTGRWPAVRAAVLSSYDRKAARSPDRAEQIRAFQAVLRGS